MAKEASLKIAILEIGAGTTVQTVREQSDYLLSKFGAVAQTTLVRVNPDCDQTRLLSSTGAKALERMSC